MMNRLKNYWYNKIIWSFIFMLIIFMIFKIIDIRTAPSCGDKIRNRINNEYNPVRITDTILAGGVDEDENGRKKAEAVFSIKNYTKQDQKVTVLLYQHNLTANEDQLFDLEHVYTCNDSDTEVEMENGVIKISGGETMKIHVIGIARDCSKAQVSGTSPSVKIIKLKYVF